MPDLSLEKESERAPWASWIRYICVEQALVVVWRVSVIWSKFEGWVILLPLWPEDYIFLSSLMAEEEHVVSVFALLTFGCGRNVSDEVFFTTQILRGIQTINFPDSGSFWDFLQLVEYTVCVFFRVWKLCLKAELKGELRVLPPWDHLTILIPHSHIRESHCLDVFCSFVELICKRIQRCVFQISDVIRPR